MNTIDDYSTDLIDTIYKVGHDSKIRIEGSYIILDLIDGRNIYFYRNGKYSHRLVPVLGKNTKL